MKLLKTLRIIIVLILWINTAFAQQANILNQKTYGGSQVDILNCGIKTTDGGLIVGGISASGVSGDKTEPNRGLYNDYWVLKLHSDLSIEWQKTIGGNHDDYLMDIVECSDGGFLCLGKSASPVSGDKTVGEFGFGDFWAVKLDSNGSILWQNIYGGTGEDSPTTMMKLTEHKYLLCGQSKSDSSGIKTEDCRGNYDFWLVCIDLDGNVLWDKTIGGSDYDGIAECVRTPTSEVILYGLSNSPISGEKTESCIGQNDLWFVKIDTNGTILWDKTYGGNSMENYGGMTLGKNSIYASCYSTSGISGNKSESCMGNGDYWIVKLDLDGNLIWEETIGGDETDMAFSIVYTTNNRVIIAGTSNSGVSSDKTDGNIGSADYWPVVLDTNGIVVADYTIGGSDLDEISDIIELNAMNFLLIGSSESGISGQKNEASRGLYDYWLVEIGGDFGISTNQKPQHTLYPNPANESITIDFSGTFNDVNISIFNLQGQMISQMENQNHRSNINLSGFEKGVYVIKFENSEGIEIAKFIVE